MLHDIYVIHNMTGMMNSYAFRHQEFLVGLGKAGHRNRRTICQSLTLEQLKGIAEVAKCVQGRKITIRRRDMSYFRAEDIFLRILASSNASDDRKRRQLIARHKILPRLLRRCYIRRSIGYIIRSS